MKSLKAALLANAASCIIFGLLFLLFSSSVNLFIGNAYHWLIPALGAILLINGAHLVIASRRSKPLCPEILYFIAGDALWVIGTIVLLGLGLVITSTGGALVAVVVAVMVGAFGAMQLVGYKRVCSRSNA